MKCFLCLQNQDNLQMFQLNNKDSKQPIKNLHYFCSQFFEELKLQYDNNMPYFTGIVENKNCIEDCIICNKASVGAYMIKCCQKYILKIHRYCDFTYHIPCIKGKKDIHFQTSEDNKFKVFCKKHQTLIKGLSFNPDDIEQRSKEFFSQNLLRFFQIQKTQIQNEQPEQFLFYQSIDDHDQNGEYQDEQNYQEFQVEQENQQIQIKDQFEQTVIKKEKRNYQTSQLEKAIQLKLKKFDGGKTQKVRQIRKPNYDQKKYVLPEDQIEKCEIEKHLVKGDINSFWNYIDQNYFNSQVSDEIKKLASEYQCQNIQDEIEHVQNIQYKQKHLITIMIEGLNEVYYRLHYQLNEQAYVKNDTNNQDFISKFDDNCLLDLYLTYKYENQNPIQNQIKSELKPLNDALILKNYEKLTQNQFFQYIKYQIDFNETLEDKQEVFKDLDEICCEIYQLKLNLKQQYFQKGYGILKQLSKNLKDQKNNQKHLLEKQEICNQKMDLYKLKKIQTKIQQGFEETKPDYQQSQFIINGQNNFFETDCNICFNTFFEENDPVVYCSKCKVSLHQVCYGIEKIPENDYFCDVCEQEKGKKRSRNIQCLLCKKQGFPLKKIENFWFHIQCLILMNLSIYNNILAFLEKNNFRIYNQIQMIDLNLYLNKIENSQTDCFICNQNQGFLIQCQHCENKMHYICAYLEGFSFKINTIQNKKQNLIQTLVTCDVHDYDTMVLFIQLEINKQIKIFKEVSDKL